MGWDTQHDDNSIVVAAQIWHMGDNNKKIVMSNKQTICVMFLWFHSH